MEVIKAALKVTILKHQANAVNSGLRFGEYPLIKIPNF